MTVRKNEVIDLSDPTVTCESWIDWPVDLHGSIGALIGDKMLICGGAFNAYKIDNTDDFPKFHSTNGLLGTLKNAMQLPHQMLLN